MYYKKEAFPENDHKKMQSWEVENSIIRALMGMPDICKTIYQVGDKLRFIFDESKMFQIDMKDVIEMGKIDDKFSKKIKFAIVVKDPKDKINRSTAYVFLMSRTTVNKFILANKDRDVVKSLMLREMM